MSDRRTDVSIVMPCLNEEATVGTCVDDAFVFLSRRDLSGEVLVVDNGSTDDSARAARAHGARVIAEPRRGYGRAVRAGIEAARGDLIVFADCDSTYDFCHMDALVDPLLSGEADLVVGNRFAQGIEPDAMPWLHRLGVPFLSMVGRLRCRIELRRADVAVTTPRELTGVAVRDFHCGQRGLTRKAANRCTFRASGMEFASEMIVEATRRGLAIAQVPVALKPGPIGRVPKLRTFSDGWRHLRLLLGLRPKGA